MKKKMMPMVLTFMMLLLIFSSMANAKEVSLSELNKYLVKGGYPQDIINTLDIGQKQSLYAYKAVYYSHKIGNQNFGAPSGDFQIESLSNFTQTLVQSKITAPAGFAKFILDYNYDWKYDPSFTLSDKFGISWSDDFDALPATARYNYKAIEQSSGATNELGNTYGYSDYIIKKGIGWSVNLIKGWGTHWSTEHKGWGEVVVQKATNSPGTTMSSAAIGDYFHKQGTTTGSLAFSGTGTPSISISYSVMYDKSNDVAVAWSWVQ